MKPRWERLACSGKRGWHRERMSNWNWLGNRNSNWLKEKAVAGNKKPEMRKEQDWDRDG